MIEGIETLIKNHYIQPKVGLQINGLLKKIGIKKIKFKHKLENDTYEKQLTFYIYPTIKLAYYGKLYISGNLTDYINKEFLNASLSNSYTLDLDEGVKILARIENEDFQIGTYCKARNIIICNFDILNKLPDVQELNSKFFAYFIINEFIKWANEAKPTGLNTNAEDIFSERFINSISGRILSLNEENKSIVDNIKNHNEIINKQIKNKIIKEQEIEALREFSKNTKKTLVAELKELKKLPFINSIKLNAICLSLDTKQVNIEYKNEKIPIGKFTIFLNPGNIKIINQTMPITKDNITYHHPHISSDNICFGSIKEAIYRHLIKGELKKAIYLIWLFLNSYNPDDRILDLENWRQNETRSNT